MLCEQILGTLSDEQFKNLKVDYVDMNGMKLSKSYIRKKLKKVVTLVSHWEMRF